MISIKKTKVTLVKRIAWVAVFFVGGLFRFVDLARYAFWRDEAFSVNLATKFSFLEIIQISAEDTSPPLYYLFLKIWAYIFGEGEFAIRFISFIFGMATLYITYKLARLVSKNFWFAYASVWFVATNSVLIFYSQEARNYAMLIFLVLTGLYYNFLILKEKKPSNKTLGLYILFMILSLYTNSTALIFFVTINLVLLPEYIISNYKAFGLNIRLYLKNKKLQKILLSWVIISLLFLPWIIVTLEQKDQVSEGFWLMFDPFVDPRYNLEWMLVSQNSYISETGLSQSVFEITKTLGLMLLGIGVYLNLQKGKYLFSNLFIATLVIFHIISFETPIFYFRYFLFLIPLMGLLIAYPIVSSNFKLRYNKYFALFVYLAFFVSAPLNFTANIQSRNDLKPDYNGLVDRIETKYADKLVLSLNVASFHSMDHYLENVYILDGERSAVFYEGVAIVKEDDYYDKELLVDEFVLVYLWEKAYDLDIINTRYDLVSEEYYSGNLKLQHYIRKVEG